MSVTSFDPTQDIAITEAAMLHLLDQIQTSEYTALRLGIKESGCNGYMYTMDFINSPEETDIRIALTEKIAIYVAITDMPLIKGTVVDYVKEGLNAALKFKNPNAESLCGCGESFSIPEAL